MNKRGIIPILGIIWGVAALAAAIGGLILIARPKPETLFSSIPIWGWILILFVILFLLRRR